MRHTTSCQEIFTKIENEIPEGEEFVKSIENKPGCDYKKQPIIENLDSSCFEVNRVGMAHYEGHFLGTN
jgi:hypothetical protein